MQFHAIQNYDGSIKYIRMTPFFLIGYKLTTINTFNFIKNKISKYMDDSKKIILPEIKTKKVTLEKPKRKRIVTNTMNWREAIEELENLETVNIENMIETKDNKLQKILLQQIKSKINGYSCQDREKKILCKEKFVTLSNVIELMKTSNMICYYCKEETMLMYEYVREPKQWTLERLDNSFGHNNDNVVISCLSCNLRRKTMASERYLKTKAMAKIIKLDN